MEVGRSESTLATVKTDDVLVGDDGRGMYCFVRVTRKTAKTVFAKKLRRKVSVVPPTDGGWTDSRYREFEPVTPFQDEDDDKPLKLRETCCGLASGSSREYTYFNYTAWDGLPLRAESDHD